MAGEFTLQLLPFCAWRPTTGICLSSKPPAQTLTGLPDSRFKRGFMTRNRRNSLWTEFASACRHRLRGQFPRNDLDWQKAWTIQGPLKDYLARLPEPSWLLIGSRPAISSKSPQYPKLAQNAVPAIRKEVARAECLALGALSCSHTRWEEFRHE